jgi:hypothetical protein
VVKSIANVRKPIIALYVGDYDPSGVHMSEIDLPDRLVEYGGEHHRVIRIGLLDHDIEDLPSIAAKPTDPRFKWYSANYGKQAWELDALDPNVLRDRVRRAILSKIDQDEWDRSRLCRRTLGAGKERRDDQRERRFRARRLNRPRSCSRPPSRSKYASTGTSSTFDPLLVPDGLSNGKQGRQCDGLNPMEIDPAMLTAGGHPPRRTRDVVAAYKRVMGGDCFSASAERVQRHKDIRAVCLECLDENAAEVCRCTTFWCPFWPYRMGRNPHNPARGRNPFRPKKG